MNIPVYPLLFNTGLHTILFYTLFNYEKFHNLNYSGYCKTELIPKLPKISLAQVLVEVPVR